VHITVPGCEGDVLLYLLDERGVHVSTGSACQAGVPEASHVLLAMGVNESDARGALRFSLSYSNTVADVDAICAVFSDVVRLATHAGLAGGR
jgi:cysteine desulfurase